MNRKRMKINRIFMVLLFTLFAFKFLFSNDTSQSLTPNWAKDLIIYEVAIKGFTSPNGPESGTFNSLKDKMDYLKELGINAIWLTGHSLSDPKHFYGIWTQYACIEPDKLDPTLGTEEEFKDMINAAHKHGIRIFLDTIEHGVMNASPLIEKHPDWFKGGSWGMTDYDWDGDHPDLDKWWIDMWTKAVLDWGVDGFRCDCGLHRPDLWLKVKQRCAEAGKPIFILGESGSENVSDACQRDIMLFDQRKGLLDNHAVLNDLASVRDLLNESLDWSSTPILCSVIYEDGSTMTSFEENKQLQIKFIESNEDLIGTWEWEPDKVSDWVWLIGGIDQDRKIDNIILECPKRNWQWQSNGWGWKLLVTKIEQGIKLNAGYPLPGPKMRVISPSCHDAGWDGFPLEKNPYMVQGSRFVFGYGVLFTPSIPIFMSGEEFDAKYKALPNHTPDLYGKGEKGKGRWLYGSWMQWDQLNENYHSQMLRDVKRMIEIRREHQDIIHAIDPQSVDLKLNQIHANSSEKIPQPYILSNGKRALLIVGNPEDYNIDVDLKITLESLGFNKDIDKFELTELWPKEKSSQSISVNDLLTYKCTVPADRKSGGGLQVIRLEIRK